LANASFVGIVFDASTNLGVASVAEGNIRKFSPAGDDRGIFTSAGLDLPRDVVVVPQGANPAAREVCPDLDDAGPGNQLVGGRGHG
jgi:hypothetical protein